VAALVVFGVIGLLSHEDSFTLKVFARAILPFPVAWLLIGPIGSVFRARVSRVRLLRAWLVAGTLALAVRALIFDRELFSAFFVIVLVGDGLFLLAWRTVHDRLLARRIAVTQP
jgi:hypothetical protein